MKRIVISSAVLALALGGMGVGSAAPATTKITGGGQTLVPAGGGAGDTVGFNAQVRDGVASGQFQYVNRGGTGTGQAQEVMHGTVTCAVVFESVAGESGGVAAFGGYLRDGETAFRVDVTDDGQGDKGSDLILVRTGDDVNAEHEDGICNDDDAPGEEAPALDRGNVTIHKAKG